MTITNASLISYAKEFYPALFGTTGTPGTLEIGDTDWSPPMAAIAALADQVTLTNGQILIGSSGTSALTNPSTGPTLTAGTGGSLALGAYDVRYTLTNTYGETLPSTATTVTLTGVQNRIAVTAITPLPAGATGVNWYVSDAPGSITPRLEVSNVGAAFNIDSVPAGGAALAPSTNTTASTSHAKKATPTGSSGIAVTAGAGSLNFAYSPTSHNDQNGYYLRRLRIENFTTGGEPTGLTTADKGRLYYNTTIPALKIWDGTAWQTAGGSTINSGTSFPGSPVSGDLFIRTDQNKLYRYNGASWDATGDGAGISTALTPAHILVGNGSSVATDVPVSGNLAMDNTGYFTVNAIKGTTIIGSAPAHSGQIFLSSSGNGTTGSATWADIPGAQAIYSIPISSTGQADKKHLRYTSGTNALVWDDVDASKINGVTISGTPATGNVLTATSTTAATWATSGGSGAALTSAHLFVGNGSNVATDVAVSGDATLANTGAITVTKVQGKAFATTSPTAGQVPTWNNSTSQYEPSTPAGGSGAANATSIQGVNVSATTPTNGQALVYNSGTSQYVPGTVSGGGTPSGTSFPGSPATEDKFYRTDRHLEYFYNGTNWLSTTLYKHQLIFSMGASEPITADGSVPIRAGGPEDTYDIYLEKVFVAFGMSGTPYDASNYWYAQFWQLDTLTGADTQYGGNQTTWATGRLPNVRYKVIFTINSVRPLVDQGLYYVTYKKTGSPAGLYPDTGVMSYRLIG